MEKRKGDGNNERNVTLTRSLLLNPAIDLCKSMKRFTCYWMNERIKKKNHVDHFDQPFHRLNDLNTIYYCEMHLFSSGKMPTAAGQQKWNQMKQKFVVLSVRREKLHLKSTFTVWKKSERDWNIKWLSNGWMNVWLES